MDFEHSAKAKEYQDKMWEFMDSHVFPAEKKWHEWRAEQGHDNHDLPPVMNELKEEAKRRGLWNLFLKDVSGMSNVEYASIAEITGWVPEVAPESINCAAPDTGNMETLHLFGTEEQKQEWLEPLLAGEIRSAFAMTEPRVASSDASNIETRIESDGDDYVINGRKWWISGTADPRCKIFILMGKTDPSASAHKQQSMVLVPRDTLGVEVVRHLPVFGYQDQHGHSEIQFTDVRVPKKNILMSEGDGFMIAQGRLGPGRIHHCMRLIGMAERAIKLMCERATERQAFGGPLSDQGVVRDQIAQSRIELEQARLLVQKAAWLIDSTGSAKGAQIEIAAIKANTPKVVGGIIDRAIQIHGGGGVSDDFPLANMYAQARTLRLADGPDEVHVRTVARKELGKYAAK
ncbi:acyl-CoA dehydrogenase [Epidermidibacterium keratini]|uniref:Acyl-CoA dehydrogenase n=1 Tax=Epidermidibacterium keratini TaxID=1891644 RepID=A0A7L4YPC2_9ACTN|nr:acyl-CoA dehydrogenase family protein [Epidermidibacterium keratini]QHC00724.1 acyl-CoA dehydrogenase [Epidermidibacterium keratini]